MPLEYGAPQRLDGRLATLVSAMGLEVRVEDRNRLLKYLGLIQQWTQVYNLTAVRNTGEMFTHHLLDCLAVVQPLRAGCARIGGPDALRVLDVGSGAGLPGVVLAILNPTWQITCIDAVAKKAAFIRQAAAELGLSNLHGVHGRVEGRATFGNGQFDLITSRAFASLSDFVRLTQPLLAPGGRWAAMKANLGDEERDAVAQQAVLFHVEQIHVPELDAARCLVWLRSLAE